MLEMKLGKELSLGKMLIWVQLTCRSSCVPFWPSDLSLFPPPPGYALPLWTTIPELTTGRLYLGCGLNLKKTDKEIHIFIYTTVQKFWVCKIFKKVSYAHQGCNYLKVLYVFFSALYW